MTSTLPVTAGQAPVADQPSARRGKGRPACGTWRRLRERRESRKLTQTAAAQECGVSQTTFSAWETGSRAPDLEDVPSLARFLGIPQAETLDDIRRIFLPADI